jgi:ribosomal protein S18 acetylase RimI-like enzyme
MPSSTLMPLNRMELLYKTDLDGVDWEAMKAVVNADDFDNGRSPGQLAESFANSYATVITYDGERIVGTARALSDGVCNAYIVDVWTHSSLRRRGIARTMMELLFSRLQGQHVYLFTADAVAFYEKLGFDREGIGLGRVVGRWLMPGE